VQREAVFAVRTIDQSYTLRQAIYAFARPDDRVGEEKYIDKWRRHEAKARGDSRELEIEFHRNAALVEETRLKQEFDTKIKVLAKGGAPHIEIHDVTVFLREPVSSPAVVPPASPLPAARKRELRVFLEELGPCNEKVARQSAEQHFNASITRDLIREQRNNRP
jgi:hypothetical protein